MEQSVVCTLLFLNNILNPTCLMRLETEALRDTCFYGCLINSFYVCMFVCIYVCMYMSLRPVRTASVYRPLDRTRQRNEICCNLFTFVYACGTYALYEWRLHRTLVIQLLINWSPVLHSLSRLHTWCSVSGWRSCYTAHRRNTVNHRHLQYTTSQFPNIFIRHMHMHEP